MSRVTFIMEQHIGHRTYYENLRRNVEGNEWIDPSWVEITYEDPASPWNRYPLLPRSIKGSLVGRTQTRKGLDQGADVVFFNTQVPAALSGKTGRLKNYVVATDITPVQYDRMSHWYGHTPDKNRLIGQYKHRINTQVLKRARFVLPWSTWTADSLVEDYHVQPERIVTIPPGVDLDVWNPGQIADENSLRILFVGGDFQRKGGDLLLEAFRALRRMFPALFLELALVTRSPVPVEPGVRVYNNLRPNSAEIVHLFQSSDIFVLPTRAEAFGIAAVEASAVGLPVIATHVGGLTDIVEDGISGFLIDPGLSEPLFDRLALLIENRSLRVAMGQAGHTRARQRFNAARNSERIIQLILAAEKEEGVPRHG